LGFVAADEPVDQRAEGEPLIVVARYAERYLVCILIWSLPHNEFSAITNGVANLLHERPTAEQWRDVSVAF
jgi:hypothetical protein